MIPGTDLHCFVVHNDGYFSHLPLTYVDGVILEIVVPRMPYEEFDVYLEEKCGCYFQETFGRLNLYLDHLDMNILKYLSQAVTYDMDACVSKKISLPKKCDDDSDYQSDKLVDYLSSSEEELIKLRNRMKANREAKAKAKDNPVSEMNEPNNENSMPIDTVGEKYESAAQFKEYLTYYALVNGFSYGMRGVTRYPGRPKKKRIRAIGEGGSSSIVSKIGYQASCSNYKKPGHNKASCTEPVVEQTLKPKGVPGRPRKNQSVDDLDDVDVVLRGSVRDEEASGSRGRGGTGGSRGDASGYGGGASVSRRGAGGSKGGASGSRECASGSRGGATRSRGRGATGSKRKHVSSAGTQKRQGKKKVGTSGFAKWLEL
ncbi:hypothetical protein Tco_0706984 [Tanacetum coccineum]|uniref:Uncharacterized protein n=1 Tax=Tanacetum coccineum TaxID=301880 RepID=A0ABQ4Y8Y7_9ASTR